MLKLIALILGLFISVSEVYAQKHEKLIVAECVIDTLSIPVAKIDSLVIKSCGSSVLERYDFKNVKSIVMYEDSNKIREFDSKIFLKLKSLRGFTYYGISNGLKEEVYYNVQGFNTKDLYELKKLKNLQSVSLHLSPYLKYLPEDAFKYKKIKSISIWEFCLVPVGILQFSNNIQNVNIGSTYYSGNESVSYPDQLLLYQCGFTKQVISHKTVEKIKRFRPPINGKFQTKYINGQLLVDGFFTNKKPHGKWAFYYSDGKKYCDRYYKNGVEDSTWVTFKYNGDSLLLMTFKEGKLVYQKSFEENASSYYSPQEILEFNEESLPVLIRSFLNNKIVVEKKGRYWARELEQDLIYPSEEVHVYQNAENIEPFIQDYISQCVKNSKKCTYIKHDSSGVIIFEEIYENGLLVKKNK